MQILESFHFHPKKKTVLPISELVKETSAASVSGKIQNMKMNVNSFLNTWHSRKLQFRLDETDQAAYTTNAFKEAQSQFDGDLIYDNFFDREYLPSGMWSVMADATSTLLADGDPEGATEEALSMVADNYNDLMGN